MTVYETAGTFSEITITYVGIHNNVANSLIAGCISLGVQLLLVTPVINAPSWDEELMDNAIQSGYVETVNSLSEAVSRSQFVYTDTWVDMEFFQESHYEDEKNRRLEQMKPFQLNKENLNGHSPYIMHDMPIHPGYEIEEELIESDKSIIYQQAENRMHVQKALLLYLLDQNEGLQMPDHTGLANQTR
nr:hypothetical protein [Paenibacillus sp. NEAU-GSW1]